MSSLMGHSIIAEPPPEMRNTTVACSSLAWSNNAKAARAAARLLSSGKGCPPIKLRQRFEL
jgi:hypothetical protein